MSAPASKPAKKPAKKPPLSDGMVFCYASLRAIDRIGCGKRDGKYPRNAANVAMRRIYDLPRDVREGVLTLGEAALEMLRIEITLKRRAPQPATTPAAETSSDAVREPHEPVVLPYDPDPQVIVPMDLYDSPEDRAAIRKAREAWEARDA